MLHIIFYRVNNYIVYCCMCMGFVPEKNLIVFILFVNRKLYSKVEMQLKDT